MCSGNNEFLGVTGLFEFDCDSQAATWIKEINLSTALSISSYVLKLKFRLISRSTKLWNLMRSVDGQKSFGGVIFIVGEALTVNKTDELSEFRFKLFSGVQYMLLGILATYIMYYLIHQVFYLEKMVSKLNLVVPVLSIF